MGAQVGRLAKLDDVVQVIADQSAGNVHDPAGIGRILPIPGAAVEHAHQVLDIGRQGVREGLGKDGVHAFAFQFDDRVRGRAVLVAGADVVAIIACATPEDVRAAITEFIRIQHVVAGAAIKQVRSAIAVDHIVAVATEQLIVAFAAEDSIVAPLAMDDIVAGTRTQVVAFIGRRVRIITVGTVPAARRLDEVLGAQPRAIVELDDVTAIAPGKESIQAQRLEPRAGEEGEHQVIAGDLDVIDHRPSQTRTDSDDVRARLGAAQIDDAVVAMTEVVVIDVVAGAAVEHVMAKTTDQ